MNLSISASAFGPLLIITCEFVISRVVKRSNSFMLHLNRDRCFLVELHFWESKIESAFHSMVNEKWEIFRGKLTKKAINLS